MKKFKLFSVLACLLIVFSAFYLVGCKKERSPEDKALMIVDGFRIESVEILNISDNYYNIEIGVKNTNEESATFDYTQIKIYFEAEELIHNGEEMLFEANKYWKMSFQVDIGDSNLSVGDSVQVYYQDTLLKECVVSEF